MHRIGSPFFLWILLEPCFRQRPVRDKVIRVLHAYSGNLIRDAPIHYSINKEEEYESWSIPIGEYS